MKLVDAGATSKYQLISKQLVISDFNDEARQEKVLFDLIDVWPVYKL